MTSFNKNLVTVIIPTYNRAILLKEAIQSVIDQSYRPIECIVVDDGSTDDTEAITSELIRSFNNEQFKILYLKQSKSGGQVARNKGTANCKGDFIQYLDSDDILYKDKLRTQVEYLINNPKCDAVFGDWDVGSVCNNQLIKGIKSNNLLKQLITLDGCIHLVSILFKRDIINKIGNWDIKLKRCQEVDFQLRGLLIGGNYDYFSLNTGLMRMHDGPKIMSTVIPEDIVYFFQKWENILTPLGEFEKDVKVKISNYLMYFSSLIVRGKKNNMELLISEAARLNSDISFYNSKKMKFLRFFLGRRISIRIWAYSYRKLYC